MAAVNCSRVALAMESEEQREYSSASWLRMLIVYRQTREEW